MDQRIKINSMPPKIADRSRVPPKGYPKASTNTTPKKPPRTSPRQPSLITIGTTPKAIARKPSPKKKVRIQKDTPSRAERQKAAARLRNLVAVLEADETTEDDDEENVEKDPIPKPVTPSIADPPSKTGEDVKLFGQVLEPQQFKLGHIISVAAHEEVYQDAKNKLKLGATREQTLTSLGWVYSKARKIVVISRFAQHLVGLPIFSHGGKGLEKKEKSEFVDIRDIQHFKNTPTDSIHPNLLSHRIQPFIQVSKNHWAVINGDSYIQFTRPLSFAYNTRCTIEGHLQDQDLNSLINLVNSRKPLFPANPAARAAPRPRKLGEDL